MRFEVINLNNITQRTDHYFAITRNQKNIRTSWIGFFLPASRFLYCAHLALSQTKKETQKTSGVSGHVARNVIWIAIVSCYWVSVYFSPPIKMALSVFWINIIFICQTMARILNAVLPQHISKPSVAKINALQKIRYYNLLSNPRNRPNELRAFGSPIAYRAVDFVMAKVFPASHGL